MIDRQNNGTPTGKRLLDLSDRMFAWWHRVRDGTLNRSSFQVYINANPAAFARPQVQLLQVVGEDSIHGSFPVGPTRLRTTKS
jgi:hypothetical protein